MKPERPLAVVNSVAPIRICDNGCWTDTWFAGHGQVFNIAVYPYAEVQIAVRRGGDAADRVVLHPENFGDAYPVRHDAAPWGPHPLLEAALAYMRVPGTSASRSPSTPRPLPAPGPARRRRSPWPWWAPSTPSPRAVSTPHEVAAAAQRVETEMLHRQCGIQDQLASAYGGINYIEMFAYPHASVSPVLVPDPVWWELERRLLLVYLGKSHDSSALHEQVIRPWRAPAPTRRRSPHSAAPRPARATLCAPATSPPWAGP